MSYHFLPHYRYIKKNSKTLLLEKIQQKTVVKNYQKYIYTNLDMERSPLTILGRNSLN